MALVAIVRHVSENDVVELPRTPHMEYGDAVAVLRQMSIMEPDLFDASDLDLVAVTADGQLGRYVSWAL